MDYPHIAVVDLETSRLDHFAGEILEIGIVVADAETLSPLYELDLKVRPEHIKTADPESLRINGYRAEDWEDAVTLADAMRQFSETVRNAEIAAWNIKFDWPFLAAALHAAGSKPSMSYHGRCIYTLARELLRAKHLASYSLNPAAAYLGLKEEPLPHRAINGARLATEVYRRLRSMIP